MKRKLLTMALCVALGVSAFGANAKAAAAQTASATGCAHTSLHLIEDEKFSHYEQAATSFHNLVYVTKYECDFCSHKVNVYRYEYEDHVFNEYRNGRCFCSLCGEEDEFYRP